MKFLAAAALTTALVLGGCSDSGSDASEESNSAAGEAQPRLYDESEIIEHLRLVDDGTGTDTYVYRGPGQVTCEIDVILASSQEVEMYANAGDNVAANSIGSAGVKFGGYELASCQEALTTALADLQ